MTSLLLYAPLVTLAVGAVVVWNNPWRTINQSFGLASLAATLWLVFVYLAQRAGATVGEGLLHDPVPWLRVAAAIGALFPWILWVMMGAIIRAEDRLTGVISRTLPLLVIAIALAALSFTDYFIPAGSTPENPRRGFGYFIYAGISFTLYAYLVFAAYREMQYQKGIRRIELQFLSVNSALTCLTAIALTAIGSYLDIRFLARLSAVAALVFYGLTAWAVTFHRVFDARQVFLSLAQRVLLMTVLCVGVLGLDSLLARVISHPFSLVLSIALGSTVILWLDRVSRDWFGLSPAHELAAIRRAITDLARSQPSPDKLVADLEHLLCEKCQTRLAVLLFDNGDSYTGSLFTLAKDRPGHQTLCRDGWATPESLQRQRPAPGLVDLRQILTEHGLGLLVTTPAGVPSPSLILALGVKTNLRPFTYPEVQRLQDVAEFADNTLARSRLTQQARQSEQLAVIGLLGASLAHEIRNPLVSIKTFAHLLPTRFNDSEFRRKFNLLIPGEVDRIDALTQQLLDLAHPRPHNFERVSLHSVVTDTIDLLNTNAVEAQVEVAPRLASDPDIIRADGSAIRQVIINLLINAYQALETIPPPRRVEVRTRNHSQTGVILEVIDNGPGIPAEQRAKLFHPFASTKTKGMGLGLAVCADILRGHGATIIVPENGSRPGATFRITFPCPPPSS